MSVTGLEIGIHVQHVLVVRGERIAWRSVMLVWSRPVGTKVLGVCLTRVQPLTTTATRRSAPHSHLKERMAVTIDPKRPEKTHLRVVGIALTAMTVLPIELRTVLHLKKTWKIFKWFLEKFCWPVVVIPICYLTECRNRNEWSGSESPKVDMTFRPMTTWFQIVLHNL